MDTNASLTPRTNAFRQAWAEFHEMKRKMREKSSWPFRTQADPSDKQAEFDRLYELAEQFERELIAAKAKEERLVAENERLANSWDSLNESYQSTCQSLTKTIDENAALRKELEDAKGKNV